jgi:hypothetical protein
MAPLRPIRDAYFYDVEAVNTPSYAQHRHDRDRLLHHVSPDAGRAPDALSVLGAIALFAATLALLGVAAARAMHRATPDQDGDRRPLHPTSPPSWTALDSASDDPHSTKPKAREQLSSARVRRNSFSSEDGEAE